MGWQSEEEYLIGQAKYRSDIDLNDQSDLPRSSNDRDVRHKRTGKMRPQKYLSIECSIANSLAALIRK